MIWQDATVLITGGTGSFGRACLARLLSDRRVGKVVIFSRDELKQHEMRQLLSEPEAARVRFLLGDVRDRDRLYRAFDGVDVVIHTAALKQVPACEYNPIEAVATNVTGARNVIDAAIDRGVKRVLALSTDKAVNPINLYGATKLVAEKLFVLGNAYVGMRPTRLSCVRYGNVIGSRGSVVPLFVQQRERGRLTVTDPGMTRFWITLGGAVEFVVAAIERMQGGEIFIPQMPTSTIGQLAEAVGGASCQVDLVGIRPGEKVHETLMSQEEATTALELDGMYVIPPHVHGWTGSKPPDGRPLPEGFEYESSGRHRQHLSVLELRRLIHQADSSLNAAAAAVAQ